MQQDNLSSLPSLTHERRTNQQPRRSDRPFQGRDPTARPLSHFFIKALCVSCHDLATEYTPFPYPSLPRHPYPCSRVRAVASLTGRSLTPGSPPPHAKTRRRGPSCEPARGALHPRSTAAPCAASPACLKSACGLAGGARACHYSPGLRKAAKIKDMRASTAKAHECIASWPSSAWE